MREDGIVIAGWTRNSFIDFPGTVSTVLFFAGCNCACPWCHNPAVVRAVRGEVDPASVLSFLESRRGLIDGAVMSGGEPTLQPGLAGFAGEIRSRGIAVKLDTNGLLPGAIENCRPDYLALDLKTVPSRYARLGYRGGDAGENLSRSIAIVKQMGDRAEVRIPMASGFIDSEAVEYFVKVLRGVRLVYLQPIRMTADLLDPSFAQLPPIGRETVLEFQASLKPHVGDCLVRGE